MSENPFLSIDQQIVGDVYTSSEAMDNLTILCDDFGSRFGGTAGEKQAADFFKQKMEQYGLTNVRLEPFEYTGWRRGEVKLEILSPVEKEIPCISLPHSPPAGVEATLVDLGEAAPADFDARAGEIKGSIVMANSVTYPKGSKRWIHRGEKFGRSLLKGAVAFIFVNHYPAYGPATGGVGRDGFGEALIPGISVSYEDGAILSRLVKRYGEVKVRITSSDKSEPMTSWNVLGDIAGRNPDEIVMLGSHYDGHDISQGAQDPASGAASVLEAARVLAEYAPELPCTLRFAFWGVEEIGLLGSRAYVRQHADELDQIRFYLNMDGAGAVENKGVAVNEWPQLETLFQKWGEEMAADYNTEQSLHAFSDHYPFLLKGVPTGGLQSVPRGTSGRGYGHTRYDTLDKVTRRGLRDAAALAARWALRLAGVEDWPVQRRSEARVQEILDSPDYQEAARFQAELDEHYRQARGQLE